MTSFNRARLHSTPDFFTNLGASSEPCSETLNIGVFLISLPFVESCNLKTKSLESAVGGDADGHDCADSMCGRVVMVISNIPMFSVTTMINDWCDVNGFDVISFTELYSSSTVLEYQVLKGRRSEYDIVSYAYNALALLLGMSLYYKSIAIL